MSVINFSGIASGIDSSSLIKALLDQQRKARITPLEDQVVQYQDTNSAFSELSGKLSVLNSAAQKFRSLSGGVLSKIATSSSEAVATVTASNNASNGSYSITTTQLAKNATYSFADTFSSASETINSSINDAAPSDDRTVNVTIGSGSDQESVDIELTSTTTAQDFVAQFNASSTKASASLVNVGTQASPSYKIVFNSDNQGLDKGQISVTTGTEIESAGSGALQTSLATLSQATDAQFTLSGISGTITRSTNSFSDLLTGVNINLNALGSSTITVGDDADSTANTIQDFVDAYNDVINYVSENDAVTQEQDGSGTINIFGPLASVSLDDNLLSALRSGLSSARTSGGSVSVLADLGITTQRDGTLAFDTNTFTSALQSDPNSVLAITESLGESLGAVDGTIAQYTRFNGLIDQSVNTNRKQIDDLNNRISETEKQLSQQEQSLTERFAKLEALVGRLQSQQQALTATLPR